MQFSSTVALPPTLYLADCIINIAEFEFSIGTRAVSSRKSPILWLAASQQAEIFHFIDPVAQKLEKSSRRPAKRMQKINLNLCRWRHRIQELQDRTGSGFCSRYFKISIGFGPPAAHSNLPC